MNPRQCSASTKEQVLANVAAYLTKSWAGEVEPETNEQLMQRKANFYVDSRLRIINREASFLPTFQIHGPHLPREYTDERSRIRFGRFGHQTND